LTEKVLNNQLSEEVHLYRVTTNLFFIKIKDENGWKFAKASRSFTWYFKLMSTLGGLICKFEGYVILIIAESKFIDQFQN